MNVTIKINDQLGTLARHRAVDRGLSLSGWVAEVIRKELATTSHRLPASLLEAVGNEALSDVELDFARDKSPMREVDLSQ